MPEIRVYDVHTHTPHTALVPQYQGTNEKRKKKRKKKKHTLGQLTKEQNIFYFYNSQNQRS